MKTRINVIYVYAHCIITELKIKLWSFNQKENENEFMICVTCFKVPKKRPGCYNLRGYYGGCRFSVNIT